jgi:hypothetical protein
MTTLWKRANGPQERMLRVIAGAVRNTAQAHPGQLPDDRFARGVAKRAVGTISAQWAELLAAKGESREPSGQQRDRLHSRRSRRHRLGGDGRGVTDTIGPFTRECRRLGRLIAPLRAAGDTEAVECLIVAIRALAPIARRERGKAAP